jgi:hypothetical protein
MSIEKQLHAAASPSIAAIKSAGVWSKSAAILIWPRSAPGRRRGRSKTAGGWISATTSSCETTRNEAPCRAWRRNPGRLLRNSRTPTQTRGTFSMSGTIKPQLCPRVVYTNRYRQSRRLDWPLHRQIAPGNRRRRRLLAQPPARQRGKSRCQTRDPDPTVLANPGHVLCE